MTKTDKTFAAAVAAARAAMTKTIAWHLTDEARDYRTHGCPQPQEIAAAARHRGWEAGLNVLDQLTLTKKARRVLADRLCAEVGCEPEAPLDSPVPEEVAEAFAELRRREDNLATFRSLRASLEGR
jgi:hypothetical protein